MYYKLFFFSKKVKFNYNKILYIITFTLFNKQRNNLSNIIKINALKVMIRKIFHAKSRQNEKLNKFDFLCKSIVVFNTINNVCKM